MPDFSAAHAVRRHTNTRTQPDGLSGSFYLVSVHKRLAVAGSPPGDVRQRLALSHTGDHGGAAFHRRHVFQQGDVGLDCGSPRTKTIKERGKMVKKKGCEAEEKLSEMKAIPWGLELMHDFAADSRVQTHSAAFVCCL